MYISSMKLFPMLNMSWSGVKWSRREIPFLLGLRSLLYSGLAILDYVSLDCSVSMTNSRWNRRMGSRRQQPLVQASVQVTERASRIRGQMETEAKKVSKQKRSQQRTLETKYTQTRKTLDHSRCKPSAIRVYEPLT